MVKEDTYDSTTAIYPLINVKYHIAIHASHNMNREVRKPDFKTQQPPHFEYKKREKD